MQQLLKIWNRKSPFQLPKTNNPNKNFSSFRCPLIHSTSHIYWYFKGDVTSKKLNKSQTSNPFLNFDGEPIKSGTYGCSEIEDQSVSLPPPKPTYEVTIKVCHMSIKFLTVICHTPSIVFIRVKVRSEKGCTWDRVELYYREPSVSLGKRVLFFKNENITSTTAKIRGEIEFSMPVTGMVFKAFLFTSSGNWTVISSSTLVNFANSLMKLMLYFRLWRTYYRKLSGVWRDTVYPIVYQRSESVKSNCW